MKKALLEQGRWSWGRNKLAQLVNILFDKYRIKWWGLTLVFAEKDESSGLKSLEEIERTHLKSDNNFHNIVEQLRPKLDYDQVFANSLKGCNVVLGYYFRHDNKDDASKSVGVLPPPHLLMAALKAKTSISNRQAVLAEIWLYCNKTLLPAAILILTQMKTASRVEYRCS